MGQRFRYNATGVVLPELCLVQEWQDGMYFLEVNVDEWGKDCRVRPLVALGRLESRDLDIAVLLANKSVPFASVNPDANVIVWLPVLRLRDSCVPVQEHGLWIQVANEVLALWVLWLVIVAAARHILHRVPRSILVGAIGISKMYAALL